MNGSKIDVDTQKRSETILKELLTLKVPEELERFKIELKDQTTCELSFEDANKIVETMQKEGIKVGKYPDERTLKESFKATLMIILIKIDTTQMPWGEASDILLNVINKTKLEDIQVIGVGTCIGWEYDFVLLAYTRGIGPDYTKLVEAIQDSTVPLVEFVGKPFMWMTMFDPEVRMRLK
ncbi:MAG: hypothetical protein KAT65_16595 [Methanophagales archaeon]|nr:hypothetical protein [Methanophagales archaeon]